METRIIKIGNSQGVIIPKHFLKQMNTEEKVEIEMSNGVLIIKPIKKVREGWEEAAMAMHLAGDDNLLIPDTFEDDDIEEWK
jgi:antitoxin MazE